MADRIARENLKIFRFLVVYALLMIYDLKKKVYKEAI